MTEALYQDLGRENPDWGKIAILPWDTEIFGFAVATFAPGDLDAILASGSKFEQCLVTWAADNKVALISCAVPSGGRSWRALLPTLGFAYVDSTLRYTVAKLQTTVFPRQHRPVRLATAADQQSVEQICESGFRAGRYHADPRFPLPLARRRYRQWLANEFGCLNDSNRIYVIGEPGAAVAFTHVQIQSTKAYISIGGAAPSVQSGVIPFAMFIGTLEAVRDTGVHRVESKLSAGNTPMINLAAYAGSHFSEPEQVFHWHNPTAPLAIG